MLISNLFACYCPPLTSPPYTIRFPAGNILSAEVFQCLYTRLVSLFPKVALSRRLYIIRMYVLCGGRYCEVKGLY